MDSDQGRQQRVVPERLAEIAVDAGRYVDQPVGQRDQTGPDVAAGQRPQVGVPAGTWQASVSTGEWSLLGTVVVPPYTDDCVEFADAATLASKWPEAAEDLAPWLA